jgi:hypothetical protein
MKHIDPEREGSTLKILTVVAYLILPIVILFYIYLMIELFEVGRIISQIGMN